MTTDAGRASDSAPTLSDVFAESDARWQRHVELLDWQPDYRIRGPEDPFTPAQEYLHHAHWLEYATAIVRARLDGAEPPPRIEDTSAQNDAWAMEDARVPHGEAKARAESARIGYIEAVRATGRGDDRFVMGVRGNLVGHVDQHFAYMVNGMLEHESMHWERITAALDSHSRGRLHRGDDGISWEAVDIYAHLHRWMWIQFPRVEAYLETGEVPELEASVDELNARWLAEDDRVKFENARRHAFRTRDRFVRMMQDIPIEKWSMRLVGLCVGNSVGHYQEHLNWIVRDA
ncbi:MAG: hypothetical protein KC461_08670 [Dehalococcoidia bacterium]|nr:hypothetical protein [Dehalococcoidia bacterium]